MHSPRLLLKKPQYLNETQKKRIKILIKKRQRRKLYRKRLIIIDNIK